MTRTRRNNKKTKILKIKVIYPVYTSNPIIIENSPNSCPSTPKDDKYDDEDVGPKPFFDMEDFNQFINNNCILKKLVN